MSKDSGAAAKAPAMTASTVSLAAKWLFSVSLAGFFVWITARDWPLDKIFVGDLSWGTDGMGRSALRMVSSGEISWSLAGVSLVESLLLFFAIHWLRVIRWRQFLSAFTPVSLRIVNRVGAVGFMAIFLLPFRLGEVVRPLLISRETDVPFGTAVATIAVERVVDGLMVSLLMFVVLMGVPEAQLERYPKVQLGAYTALTIFSSALIVLVATAVARDWTIAILRKLIGIVSAGLADKVIGIATSFVDGVRVLKSVTAVAQFIGITAVYWGITGLNIWVIGDGFGVQMPIVAAMTMMCCMLFIIIVIIPTNTTAAAAVGIRIAPSNG